MVASLSEILTTIQQGVTAANNLAQLLTAATTNSSSLRVSIASTFFLPSSAASGFLPSSAATGSVTLINTGVGLVGGPISTSGTISVALTTLSNSLSSNVAVSTGVATYVDGPTVTQGTTGLWFASGGVTLTTTVGPANLYCKLWDGTTVMDSGNAIIPAANGRAVVSLSGFVTNPASNVRISVNGPDGFGGLIEANRTGNGKDSTLNIMRIG